MANFLGGSLIQGYPILGRSGTDNYIPKFSGNHKLVNSLIYDDGTNVGIDKIGTQKLDVNGNVQATTIMVNGTTVIESDAKISYDKIKNAPSSFTPSAHTHSLESLTDTTLASPLSGNILIYNGSKWVNRMLVANDVPVLDTSKVTTGTFNIARIPTGTTATTVSLGNHNHSLASLTDTTITTATSLDILSYDGAKWVNSAVPIVKAILPQGYQTTKTTTATTQWTKIASINLKAVNAIATGRFVLTGGEDNGGTGTSPVASVFFRVKQVGAMATAPVVGLRLMENQNITISEFKAITTANTASDTTVDLYVNVIDLNEIFSIVPTFIRGSVTFFDSQALVTTLPTGTQTNAIYDTVEASALPIATSSALGGVKVTAGNGLAFASGLITHATGAGNNHVPTGGASGNVLRYSASGTAVWGFVNGSEVVEDSSHRLITDAERVSWNAKPEASTLYTKTNMQTNGQSQMHFGNLTNVPSSFTPAEHTHTTLSPVDNRIIKPLGVNNSTLSLFFTSEGGLTTGTGNTTYQDLLVLNTYGDTSGGLVNALAFNKSTMRINHYQALQNNATTWGTPKTLAYTSDMTWDNIINKPTYDNYSSWILKANTEATGIDVGSGAVLDIKGAGATTVSRSGSTITITSTDLNTNNYLTGVSGSGNGTVTLTRNGLANLTWSSAHTHDFASITGKPTTISGFGITDAYTSSQVDAKIAGLIASAPSTLDTLNELASALGDDPNFATTVTAAIGKKADSTNVYTKTELQTNSTAQVHFSNLTNVPTAFTPSAHLHDDRYYTESETDTKLTTKADKTIAINTGNGLSGGGDLSASRTLSVNFAGTGTLNTPARSDHNHDDKYVGISQISATLPATAGWYRIATSAVGINRNSGRFEIDWTLSGVHGQVTLNAGIMYSTDPTLNQMQYSSYTGFANGITKARIVYHNSFSSNYAYLEVYNAGANALTVNVQLISSLGWSLVAPNTVGAIPSGYTNLAIDFADGIVTDNQLVSRVATGISPLQVSSSTLVTNLNADMVDGLHSSAFLRRDAGNDVDLRLAQSDGRGLRFWDADAYKIHMSTSTNATWGGRLDSTSDYNMYFRMGGGTNRGWVFGSGAGNANQVFQIEGTGQVRAKGKVITEVGLDVGETSVIDSFGKMDYSNLKNTPTEFTPVVHNHDERYVKGTANLAISATQPSSPTVNDIWIDITD